jgi:hemerythrin-like domain-containing protein
MNLPLPGHRAPAVGMEVPLEMLAACHQRVARQCELLLRLEGHLASQGGDTQARDAAKGLMRYFDTAARDHHQDEEIDLFPALIESMAGSDAVCLRELTASLAAEHRELERQWQDLRAVLVEVAEGRAHPFAAGQVAGFTGLYARHIEREEAELLPMARRLLGDAELDRIGLAMRRRRVPD